MVDERWSAGIPQLDEVSRYLSQDELSGEYIPSTEPDVAESHHQLGYTVGEPAS